MSYIEDVACLAHNNSNSDPQVPEFNACIQSFREKRLTEAQAVEKSGLAGNENPSDFEKEVVKLLKDPDGTAAAISAAKVAAAQANADVAVERAKAVAASAAAEAEAVKVADAEAKKAESAKANLPPHRPTTAAEAEAERKRVAAAGDEAARLSNEGFVPAPNPTRRGGPRG